MLAISVNQLLGGCLTEQLLTLAVALRSEGTEVESALGTLGISVTSMMWEHLKSGWLGALEELIRKVKMDCDR